MRRYSQLILSYALALGAAGFIASRIARQSRFLSLRGTTCVITGGSRGLGLNIARVCIERGAKVAICARTADQVERARVELTRRGGDVFAAVCDVTDREQLESFIRDVAARFGTIDLLFNNAGVIQVGPMREMTTADFDEAFATHVYAPLHATLAVLPLMRAAGRGRIVNVSSIGGRVSVPHMLPYSASKFALIGLSEGLRSELAREKFFVTTVVPGLFRSGSTRNALFKGRHEEEHAWFATSDALPGVSMGVERLARQIVNAAQHGDAELTTPMLAKMQTVFATTFPNWTADINSLINAMLPKPGGIGQRRRPGSESDSETPAFANALNARAASANNEL